MMKFQDFCETVEKNIQNYLPPRYRKAEVMIQKKCKVNLGEMVGISVTMPGSMIGPIIYLNDYYAQVSHGRMTMEDALGSIAREGAKSLDQLKNDVIGKVSLKNLNSWEAMKDKVYLSAVGRTRNEELLKNVPHREMGDIACTYRIHLMEPGGSSGSILVTNESMKGYGITEAQLYQAAVANTLKNDPPTLNHMSDVIGCIAVPGAPTEGQKEKLQSTNLLREEEDRQKDDRDAQGGRDEFSVGDDIPLMVLTNSSMMMGAASVFVPGVMEKIQEKMPEGFYVLPSSIHEVMIFPKSMGSDPHELDEMISDINETQVAPDEQLSDLCHEYDADRKLLVCPTAPELNKTKEEEHTLETSLAL